MAEDRLATHLRGMEQDVDRSVPKLRDMGLGNLEENVEDDSMREMATLAQFSMDSIYKHTPEFREV